MSDLAFITFDSGEEAEEVRTKFLRCRRTISSISATPLSPRGMQGPHQLNQLFHTTAAGALSGASGAC